MRKHYTITLVLETPTGREYLKDFTYRNTFRRDAIWEIDKKIQHYRELGYVSAYIGAVHEWSDVWF